MDDRYYIIGVSRNKNNLLVTMGYKVPQTAKTLESRLFHVKMSDLKFETKNTLLQQNILHILVKFDYIKRYFVATK